MLQKDYPLLSKKINNKNLIYFDSSCTYLKNINTINEVNRYYTDYSCCSGDRESSYLWSLLQEEIDNTRAQCSKFIWAQKNDFIVFTSWTTDSINRLIFSIDESKIKNIITSDLEHNSNYLPQFEYSKTKNINFVCFKYKDILDLDILETKLEKITWWFLLCFTHCSNIIWSNFDLQWISELVHKYWWHILVDDAQFIAHNRENVVLNNIDFLAFSAHKIWWPTWIWVLYVKFWSENIIKYSSKIWWGTIINLNNEKVEYKKLPYFLEWWVQNFWWILWLKWCINYYNKISYEKINIHINILVKHFWNKFYENNLDNYFEILSLGNSLIITLKPKNFNVIDFHWYCNYFLDEYIISFRTWTMCADNYVNNYLNWDKNIMRLSFWVYNTTEEIDVLIISILKYIRDI